MEQAAEREFVVVDSYEKYSDDALVDVQARLEVESAVVIEELRDENKRRAEVAIAAAQERARKSGVTVSLQPQAAGDGTKRRGRKTNAEKAAEADAKAAANGHADDEEEVETSSLLA